MTLRLPTSLHSDADALLRRVSMHIDDAALAHIAAFEPVGTRNECLQELRRIRDHGIIAKPLKWVPREVLEFMCWHEPDDPDYVRRNGLRPGTRGHWVRAFGCAALMRAYGDAETREIVHSGYYVALIQLLGSIRALNAGLEPEAMALLAWFITRLRASNEAFSEEEIAFAGLGLVWLTTQTEAASDEQTAQAVALFLAQEERSFEQWRSAGCDRPDGWLHRGDAVLLNEKWLALTRELAAFQEKGPSADKLREVGRRLAAG